jgi:sugar lactone lactonase YvrE
MKPLITSPTARLSSACGVALLASFLACHSPATAATPPEVMALGSITQSLATPSRVATDAAGNLYVTDPQAGQVVVFDGFGRMVSAKPGFAGPLAIALDAQGNIYLAESERGRVTVFGPQWNPLYTLGAGDGEFTLPSHIALDSVGTNLTVYVSDSRTNLVRAYENGVLVRSFGGFGSGPGQFNFPAGVCVNAAGDLIVVDQNNDRVQVFDRAGGFLRAWSLRPPGVTLRSGRTQGIALDGQGRVFVADTFQGCVKAFDENGVFLSFVGQFGRGVGQMLSPGGLVLDGTGRLFVACANTARVEIFGLDCFQQFNATPAAQVVGVGSNVSFMVTPACSGTYTYQWRKGTNNLTDGGTVSGATNELLTLTGVTAADSGSYTVVISGPTVTTISPAALLFVVTPPAITRGPISRTANERTSTFFDVLTTGASLGYQWLFNGSAITGANDRIITLTNLQPSDAGAYSVIVTNAAGGSTSTVATLTITALPVIAVQPASQTLPEWSILTLASEAVGSPTLTYQWYWKNVPLSGRTTTSFSLTNANPSMNGDYYLVAINAAGRATSAVATVTITPDTVPPQALSAAGGYATNRTILVAFSKAVNLSAAQSRLNYELSGPGNLTILTAVLANGTNVTLTLNGARTAGGNYVLKIKNIPDTAYAPNLLSPNPTSLPMASTVELANLNAQPWKFLQVTNSVMDSQPWTTPAFADTTWANGFGLFYGNRSNSTYQPNPNPNIRLPLVLNPSDANNTKALTIVNVFTNSGNAVREITYYYRTRFNFTGETNGAQLLIRTLIKQGAVFYLNGQEVLRLRMPSTPTKMTYATLASSSGSLTWEPTWTNAARVLPSSALVTGTNVLAVEVHQSSNTSSDTALGVKLEASVARFVAPVPTFTSTLTGNGMQFVWSDPFYLLESAPEVNGPWTTVSTTSPAFVTSAQMQNAQVQFYRLRRFL